MLSHFDPRFLAIVGIFFLIMGVYSLVVGLRRQRLALAAGYTLPWYKHQTILTGVEYLLLTGVIVLHMSLLLQLLPASWAVIIVPIYTAMMFLSAIVLCAMFYLGLVSRRARSIQATPKRNSFANMVEEQSLQQQARSKERRRSRRQKAAQARRRQSGRA
ncbi:hypothetical protein [Tengunoibacter tsumagoiensis]|uniref:Uncharacterized protein n=1 Tax=Tengunoibacter tsumagoiensis TaxID=2014871 RepID=A0A402A1T2_9CHLR|nr:hypothetical protein [Tengunoibacter tsumagoiensis]GCE13110.1 hypothetical protein KTT_29690 [Tengunoibacter tsumagoiensis]